MNKNRFTQVYVALLFLVMIIFGASKQAFGALISRIIAHYDITMAQAGLLFSVNSVGNFVALFIIAVFAGRINKMLLIGLSMFLMTISIFLISAAPPFSLMFVCFAFMGIFGTTAETLINPLVADLRPVNVSRNMSWMHGLYGLGGLGGPIVIERLISRMSWARIYFLLSAVFIVYLIVYAIVVRRQWSTLTQYVSNEKQSQFGFADILKFFTLKRNILLWLTMGFYVGSQSILSTWIKRYVEIQLGLPVWGAYALSALWLGTTASRLLISPNIKASPLLQICVGNLISVAALIAGLLSGSAGGITAATLMVGLSSGFTLPLVLAISCEWYPKKTTFGTLMLSTASFIAFIIFPPFSGFVSDHSGMLWGVAVGAACTFLATAFSGVLYFNLKSNNQLTEGV